MASTMLIRIKAKGVQKHKNSKQMNEQTIVGRKWHRIDIMATLNSKQNCYLKINISQQQTK